jgi:hypothetical protein
MPEPVEAHHVFIGEHYWSPADRGFGTTAETWREPREECPTSVTLAARHHVQESADFDCSVDEGSTLRLPSRTLAESLGVTWTGSGADFSDPTGTIVAFDPSALSGGPSVLLAQLDPLRSALGEAGLALCWALLGERSVRDPVSRSYMTPFVHFSGACLLSAQGLSGFVKHWRHDRSPSGDPVVTELAQTETDVVL